PATVRGARREEILRMKRIVCLFSCILFSTNLLFSQSATPVNPAHLKVALFPYIPDSNHDVFKELQQRIKREFETQNSGVDLELHPMNPEEDFYNLDNLKNWLTRDPERDEDAFDVV